MGRHGGDTGAHRDETVATDERPDAIARIHDAARDDRALIGARAILESLAISLRCDVVALELSSGATDGTSDGTTDGSSQRDHTEELMRVGGDVPGADIATLQESLDLQGYGSVGAVRFDRDASLTWTTHERLLASSGARALLHQFECLVHCQAVEEERARLAFAHDLSRALADVRSLDDAIDIVLARVCDATGWTYGEAWLPDAGHNVLQRTHRLARGQGLTSFATATASVRLARGRGVPGQAWSTGAPILELDVGGSRYDPRAPAASACGLSASLAVPVAGAMETVAIFSFFDRDAARFDRRTVTRVSTVLAELGATLVRARADGAMQAADRSQRALLESLAQYVITTDPHGKIASCNDAFLRAVGDAREDAIGANVFARYTREPRRERLRVWRAVRNGVLEPLDVGMFSADGSTRAVRWHGVLLSGHDGTTIGMTSFGTEIPARRESGERPTIPADSVDGSDDAMLLIDEEQRVSWANKRFASLLELSRDSVLGERIFDLVRKYPAHESLRVLADLCQAAVKVQRDHQRRHSDGRIRTLRTNFDPVRDGRGQVMHYLVSLRDVTEERARQRSLQRLSSAVRMSSEGIAITDAEGCYVLVNEAFAALHGYSSVHDLRGTSWTASLEPGVRGGFVADLERTLARQGTWTGDVPVRRLDGSSIVARYALSALDEDGMVIAAHDQTSRVLAERELIRARDVAQATTRAQANFVTVVSHELRTPLNAIIGFSDLVMKRSGDRLDERERDYLGRVRASGTSLLSIIDAILTHARAESGSLTLERQRVDVAALVHDVARLAEGLRHAPNVKLHLSVAKGLPPVHMDPLRLTQVVTNLVSNALKFTPHGEVLLSVTGEPDGSQRITVRDTGIGIPADRLAAIWTPFEQAEAGTARRYGGTGLGLPIARSLALLMGLQLEVVSEPGAGSTFSVSIPAEWVLAAE